jgi:hypothetical protein
MEGTSSISVPIPDHDHVGETFQGALEIIFCFSGRTSAVVDRKLSDLKAFHL